MDEIFSFRSDAISELAQVVAFEGEEAVGELYHFRVGLQLTAGMTLDMEAAVNARACLRLVPEVGTEHAYHGIIASLELLHAWEDHALYQAVLVPQLWHLGLTRHSWVWTDTSSDAVIREVLERNGIEQFELKLEESYETREHICQYDESDLDFISRWMEREGMYYYFDHSGEQEKLIISDSKSFQKPSLQKPVAYAAGSRRSEMHHTGFSEFRCRRSAIPQKVQHSDYNYRTPGALPKGKADGASASVGVISHFGRNMREGGEGNRLSKVRAEAFLANQAVYHGRGRVYGLRPGFTYRVADHPVGHMNNDFLARRVRHVGNRSAESEVVQDLLDIHSPYPYRVDLEAIEAETQFRPEKRSHVPRIDGAVHATVDGPADSEYAQIDDQGRYLVKIMFDEAGSAAGEASMRVRMMQPHAGAPEGFHFPLRKETEVLLMFLGGDPDRPVIAGAIPNPQTPSPVTESNHTENVIWTGSDNRMIMEDKKGSQYIHLHTPTKDTYQRMGSPIDKHHFNWHTDGHAGLYVGKDWDVEIGDEGSGNLTEHVTGDVKETYDQNQTLLVKQDRSVTVDGDQTVLVKGTEEYTVKDDQTVAVKENRDTTVDLNETLTVGVDQEHHVKGKRKMTVDGQNKLEVKGGYHENKTTGKYKIECDEHEVYVLSSGMKERINGGYDGDVNGNYALVTHGNFDHTISLNTTISHHGKYDIKYLGPKKTWKYVDEKSATYGISQSMFFGLKNEGSLSAKVENAYSLTLTSKAGIDIGVNATFNLVSTPVKIKDINTKIETGGVAAYIKALFTFT